MFSKRLVFAQCDWSATEGALADLNPIIDALGGVIDWPDQSAESIWGWAVEASRLIELGSGNPHVLNRVLEGDSCDQSDKARIPPGPATAAEVLLAVLDWLSEDADSPFSAGAVASVKQDIGEISASPSKLAVGYALKLLDEAGEDASELRAATAAASLLLLEVAFWRGKGAEKYEAARLRSKGGKARAANLVENPERALAIDCAGKNPGLSALQIKSRAKLKASERTIRGWVSAAN